MKRPTLKGVLQVIAIAIAVPLFFMLLVTVTDKIAYGEDRLWKEAETYSTIINGKIYSIPIIVPKSFTSWPTSTQGSRNPEYGIVQWTSPTNPLKIRLSALIHLPTNKIKVGAYGLQDVAASHWWIWQDGKVYEVDKETAMEHIKYLESLTST